MKQAGASSEAASTTGHLVRPGCQTTAPYAGVRITRKAAQPLNATRGKNVMDTHLSKSKDNAVKNVTLVSARTTVE